MTTPILTINGLSVEYPTPTTAVQALRTISLSLRAGETLAIVGESGCGKSTLARALLGVLGNPGRVIGGTIHLNPDLVIDPRHAAPHQWQRLRRRLGWVVQDPFQALNPTRTIGSQMLETLALHRQYTPSEARAVCIKWLQELEFNDPERIFAAYPFQLSGGMCQRAALGLALIGHPSVLIADEPTTALDLRIQQRVLRLLQKLQRQTNLAIMFISHDLSTVAGIAQRVAVMYAGQIVEIGTTSEVFETPRHPYTRALLECLPHPLRPLPQPLAGHPPSLMPPPSHCAFLERCKHRTIHCHEAPALVGEPWGVACWNTATIPASPMLGPSFGRQERIQHHSPTIVLQVQDVAITQTIKAWGKTHERQIVRDGSFNVRAGEVVGLVGESGSGKTTLARAILRFVEIQQGRIILDGTELTHLRGKALRAIRRHIQPVFQDPRGALNPRRSVIDLVAEPLHNFQIGPANTRRDRAESMLINVGLDRSLHHRKPSTLSTGQCQRVAIARALIVQPKLLICDEPTSALDISIQAQILNLFVELQAQFHFGMVFISHNLSAVQAIAQRIIVLRNGVICEDLEPQTLESPFRHSDPQVPTLCQ